ncbi:MAG: type II secretion system F family protein [Acidobacteria bacterium]|nr:type II secretion system F family protein [Acidobacteriota bacterium]
MTAYVFRVGTPEGEVVERKIEAPSLERAQTLLRGEGFHVFEGRRASLLPQVRFGKVISTEKFLLFNQELLALVRAGLPIVQSLDLLLERQSEPRFQEVLREIRDEVRSGVALSDAFAARGNIFPPIYSNSIRAGERSGDLTGVLKRFLAYQKLIVSIRKRVTGALVYPAVLISLSVIMIFIMLTRVIPNFTSFFEGMEAQLPAFTKLVIAVSFFMRDNTFLILAGLIAAWWLFRRWTATDRGRIMFDHFKLKIPFMGSLLRSFSVMQFSEALGTLLSGGIPMVPALETAADSVSNRYAATKIGGIVQNVREGAPVWHSLESTGVMTNVAIEMIKVGESTGALVEMLENVGEFYDEEIESRLSRMMALFEPLILVVLGLFIAALLIAFYLPLFEVMKVQRV